MLVESKFVPRSNPKTVARLVPPTPASLPPAPVAPQPTPLKREGKNGVPAMPRLFDKPCDQTLCPVDSFCANDYTWGRSRCHCYLGKGGESCSEGRPSVGQGHGGGLALLDTRGQVCCPPVVSSNPLSKISLFFF